MIIGLGHQNDQVVATFHHRQHQHQQLSKTCMTMARDIGLGSLDPFLVLLLNRLTLKPAIMRPNFILIALHHVIHSTYITLIFRNCTFVCYCNNKPKLAPLGVFFVVIRQMELISKKLIQ